MNVEYLKNELLQLTNALKGVEDTWFYLLFSSENMFLAEKNTIILKISFVIH